MSEYRVRDVLTATIGPRGVGKVDELGHVRLDSNDGSPSIWVDPTAPDITVTKVEPEPQPGELWAANGETRWLVNEHRNLVNGAGDIHLASELLGLRRLYPPEDTPDNAQRIAEALEVLTREQSDLYARRIDAPDLRRENAIRGRAFARAAGIAREHMTSAGQDEPDPVDHCACCDFVDDPPADGQVA